MSTIYIRGFCDGIICVMMLDQMEYMDKVEILGVQIDNIDMSGALRRIETALIDKKLCRVVTPNPEILLKACIDFEYKEILNMAELAVPDGFGLVMFSSLRNVVPGVDLSEKIAELACRKHYKLFLLGARPAYIALMASEVWRKRYPGLQIVGAYGDCTYKKEDVAKIVQKIDYAKPDIVMVAFGAPHQERWIFDYFRLLPTVRVWMGIGGTFDFVSGVVRRAPSFVQKLHLEWLWRLIKQPHRIGRIWNAVVVFPLKVMWWKFKF